jgi:hypothetical protein
MLRRRNDDSRLADGESGREVPGDRLGELIELGVDLHRMICVLRGPQKLNPRRLHEADGTRDPGFEPL